MNPIRWAVFMGSDLMIVEGAKSVEGAKMKALEMTGQALKPWLARDWRARLATKDDLARVAAAAKKDPTEQAERLF